MHITRRGNGEAVVIVHSYRNRSLGTFLVFLGLVCAIPLWYLGNLVHGHRLRDMHEWYPGFGIAAGIIFVGYMLALHSRKMVSIKPGAVSVKEGLLAKPMLIEWSGGAFVRLQHLIDERSNRAGVLWLVKLGHERSEYTVDERENHQLEARFIAESIAKTLKCPLIEKTDTNLDVTIDSADLDLPFRQRVQKYPALMGKPAPRPATVPIAITNEGPARRYTWGMGSAGLMVDVIVLGGIFLILSLLPTSSERPSAYETAVLLHNFTMYYWAAGILAICMVMAAGVQVRLDINNERATLSEKLWGFPFSSSHIPLSEVEEINLHLTMRGPVVQLVSDRNVLQFRVSDPAVAAWLTSDIRAFLGGEAAASAPTPAAT